MHQIVIETYCDECLGKGEEVAADSQEIAIGSQRGQVDLCSACTPKILGPILQLLQVRSRAQKSLRKPSGRRQDYNTWCSACTPPQRMGLRSRGTHAELRHSVGAEKITWLYGADVLQVWVCSCGLDYPTENGARTHATRAGHAPPEDWQPQEPARRQPPGAVSPRP
jgi:hypothetical protein